jgi:hypothetical protein
MLRCDAAYVIFLWGLNGCINTNSYVIAPKLVAADQKAVAAGTLAIFFQISHVVGLGLAVAVCFALFGGIDLGPR